MVAKKAKDHEFCRKTIEESEGHVKELEQRLETSFKATKEADDKLLAERTKWADERADLKTKIKGLEEDVKHEKRRATQALDVAESTSDAAGGISRLLRQIVDNDVMETLRLAGVEQRAEARERLRHRTPV